MKKIKRPVDSALALRSSSLGSSLRAKKSLGQNFLVDERVVERIVGALRPREDETVVEIGPGRGALTSRLVGRAGRLLAVEFDRDLIPSLKEQFGGGENFCLFDAG